MRADPKQAASEISRLVSVSVAGIGVAVSPDDAVMVALLREKLEMTFKYAVGFKPMEGSPKTAEMIDNKSRSWLESNKVKLAGAGAYAALKT